uniref:Inositol oxygenase n=1 Tax=Hyaloperonospora arabidopsidis (strain Emoy2) TaxID=559515 RepID=M4C6P0_HYAAE
MTRDNNNNNNVAAPEQTKLRKLEVTGNVAIGKAEEEFRNYEDSDRHAIVSRHYALMRQHQTVAFQEQMLAKYGSFSHAQMTIREAFAALEGYVDSSDPDSELPNLEHMLQTAEGIRAAGHPEWFQLVGLVHDMGKIQYLWGRAEDGQEGTAHGDQWALGGDTWVVGCRIPDSVVFPTYNATNPDMSNPRYNTKYGMYESHCGFRNLKFAWGHDEYLYQMLKFNKTTIPEEGLAMIRYHSCYPWHTKKEYRHLMMRDETT